MGALNSLVVQKVFLYRRECPELYQLPVSKLIRMGQRVPLTPGRLRVGQTRFVHHQLRLLPPDRQLQRLPDNVTYSWKPGFTRQYTARR